MFSDDLFQTTPANLPYCLSSAHMKKHRFCKRCPVKQQLFAQTQAGDQVAVCIRLSTAQVRQQTATLADHFQQATAGMEVLGVGCKVVLQVKDARGKQGDLYFGRAAVAFFALVFFDDFAFVFSGKHGILQVKFTLPMAVGL